jgi:4-hydroxybenzoyl-CoA thioesterase
VLAVPRYRSSSTCKVILAARLARHSLILGVATTIIVTSRRLRSPSYVEEGGKRSLVSKKLTLSSRKTIHIEWGDCDPAQIVHYPRYLAYFDACTTALFKKAGLSKRQMLKTYQIVGIPLVDLRASFKAPSRFSDTVVVESEITEWRRSSFCVRHRLFNKGVLAVECFEIRVWAAMSEIDPERIESKLVPREVVEMFFVEDDRRPARQRSRRKKP